jgi:hypothetical protein
MRKSYSPPPPVTHPSFDREVGKRDSVYRAMLNPHEETTYSSILEEKCYCTVDPFQPAGYLTSFAYECFGKSYYDKRNIVYVHYVEKYKVLVYTADTAEFIQTILHHETQ